MKKYMINGLKILQIHLGSDHKINKKRIKAVSNLFPGKLTLHAGARFINPKEDVAFLNEINHEYGDRILLVVQPAPRGDYSILKFVSDNSMIPVFAHYYKTIDDIQRIIDMKAAKGVWVHTYRMGGFYLCSKIANLVKKNRLGLHLGNGGACGITTTAGSHLTAGTEKVLTTAVIDDLKYPHLRITIDKTMPKLKDGARLPSEKPGLGLTLKPGFKQILKNRIKLLEIN
jgi:L-alanine-DL-glutamate epimerase-like enolase superfamily enzyme